MFDKYFVTQNLLQNVHSYFNWPSLNAPWEQLMEIGQMWKTGQSVQNWANCVKMGSNYYMEKNVGRSVCHLDPNFVGYKNISIKFWPFIRLGKTSPWQCGNSQRWWRPWQWPQISSFSNCTTLNTFSTHSFVPSSPKKFQDHNILNKAEWHEEISSLVLQWVSIF